jgi:hypothetical protein
MNSKVCSKCHMVKPLNAFHRHKRHGDGRQYRCRACNSEHQRLYRAIPSVNARQREYYRLYNATNRDQRAERDRLYRAANRKRINSQAHAAQKIRAYWLRCWIITILGGECAKCGTTENLCIDHIRENGKEHRLACGIKTDGGNRGKRVRYYADILKVGCDPTEYQVLCNRHNIAKSVEHKKSS